MAVSTKIKYVTFQHLLYATFVADTSWGFLFEPACVGARFATGSAPEKPRLNADLC